MSQHPAHNDHAFTARANRVPSPKSLLSVVRSPLFTDAVAYVAYAASVAYLAAWALGWVQTP